MNLLLDTHAFLWLRFGVKDGFIFLPVTMPTCIGGEEATSGLGRWPLDRFEERF